MTHKEIFDRFTQVFLDVMDLDHFDLTDDVTANDVAEWDSLSHVRLIVAVEREFKISFTNAEVESFKNVGDLVAAIERKLG